MTPKLKGTSPLLKKCALDTLILHFNPFRPSFLFKKAPTKTLEPKTTRYVLPAGVDNVKAFRATLRHIWGPSIAAYLRSTFCAMYATIRD